MEEYYTNEELVGWLTLIRAPGLSPVKIRKLLDNFNSPEQIIAADVGLLAEAGLKSHTIDNLHYPDSKKIEDDITWLEITGNHFVSCLDERYPTLLKELSDQPAGLFVRGCIDALTTIQIAIVGSRKPTPGGKRNALEFAEVLAQSGLTITSGLAVGIDSCAHQGALVSNSPTIAVLGNGLDIIYPRINRDLAEKICETGALVSEFPLKSKPLPANFPKRNRIISGMCVGTLVVEAAIKSGSLITAYLAIEQGREVFAVPGSIQNPVARGCHALISDGAKLTTTFEDILEDIGPLSKVIRPIINDGKKSNESNEILDEQSKLLLDNIGYDSVTVDQLVDVTGIPANVVSILLMNMELQNRIISLPGGRLARK